MLLDPKDGTHITASQVEYLFQIIGENPSRSEVTAALSAIGKASEDSLTFDECVAALKAYVHTTTESKTQLEPNEIIRVITQALDPNNLGTLSKDGLVRLLGEDSSTAGLERLTRDELEQIFAELKSVDGTTIQAADFFSLLLDI